jgi:hypothetical protein
MKLKSLDLKTRILGNITKTVNGCWEWNGSKTYGYGKIIVGSRLDGTRKTARVHRIAYQVFVGEIPQGKFVCHKCDNPSCVNPEHLFLGTRQDNVDDREQKNRNHHVIGEKNPKSKMTDAKVIEARELYSYGYTSRMLAEKYGMDHTTILDIVKGRSWKHLLPEPPTEKEV